MRSWKALTALGLGVALVAALGAQTGYRPWLQPTGEPIVGFVLNCDDGNAGRRAVPCGGSPLAPLYAMTMPFVRATQDPIRFAGITTTAKTFPIVRPTGATSYRFVNPCDVDVRIRKVGSLAETITPAQGTLFLARTSETLGTSDPQFVSLIAMGAPTGTCTPELGYGNGG